MKATAGGSKQGVSGAQMREAERGLRMMLGGKFPRAWIAEHEREVLGQAHVEYQQWLKANPPARNPVGWLCTCAYRRALNIRDSERRRPHLDPLDTVFHVPDEKALTPEQEVLDRDRLERLHKALGHLPEKEVKLLALVYFEDNSIREAGRKLGWQKSAADRHHSAAMAKLRALVGDDRSLFSPASLGLAAYLACEGGRVSRLLDTAFAPVRGVVAGVTEIASLAARRLDDLARTLLPYSDAGTAMANSGFGRAAGACGAGIVMLICVGAAGVVAPALNDARHPAGAAHRQAKRPLRPSSTVAPAVTTTGLPTPALPTPEPVERAERSKPTRIRQPRGDKEPARSARALQASPEQIQSEFGIESGGGVPVSGSAPAPAPEARPGPSTDLPSSSSSPQGTQPSDSAATREFGL